MVFIVEPGQGHTQQRALRQVERLAGLGLTLGGDLLGGLACEVQAGQAERLLRQNTLQRLAVFFSEHGTQRLVARHQCLECGLQGASVQFATQVQAGGNVVAADWGCSCHNTTGGFAPATGAAPGRVPGRDSCGLGSACTDERSHRVAVVGQHRRLEQGAQAQVDAQFVGQPRRGLGSGDGVAAQQQEMVICRYCLHLEGVAPHRRDARLQGIA